jgi:hypothetical protein
MITKRGLLLLTLLTIRRRVVGILASVSVLTYCAAVPKPGDPLTIKTEVGWEDGVGHSVNRTIDIIVIDGSLIALPDGLLQEDSATHVETISKGLRAISFSTDSPGETKCLEKSHVIPFGSSGFVGDYQLCATFMGRAGNVLYLNLTRRVKGPRSRWQEVIVQTKLGVELGVPCRVHLISAQSTYVALPGQMIPLTRVREESCNYLTEK